MWPSPGCINKRWKLPRSSGKKIWPHRCQLKCFLRRCVRRAGFLERTKKSTFSCWLSEFICLSRLSNTRLLERAVLLSLLLRAGEGRGLFGLHATLCSPQTFLSLRFTVDSRVLRHEKLGHWLHPGTGIPEHRENWACQVQWSYLANVWPVGTPWKDAHNMHFLVFVLFWCFPKCNFAVSSSFRGLKKTDHLLSTLNDLWYQRNIVRCYLLQISPSVAQDRCSWKEAWHYFAKVIDCSAVSEYYIVKDKDSVWTQTGWLLLGSFQFTGRFWWFSLEKHWSNLARHALPLFVELHKILSKRSCWEVKILSWASKKSIWMWSLLLVSKVKLVLMFLNRNMWLVLCCRGWTMTICVAVKRNEWQEHNCNALTNQDLGVRRLIPEEEDTLDHKKFPGW